jgi:hypothetical protein
MTSAVALVRAAACLFAGIFTGCAAGPTAFEITVHNKSSCPDAVASGMVRRGERLADHRAVSRSSAERSITGGHLRRKTANTGKVSGKFPKAPRRPGSLRQRSRDAAAADPLACLLRLQPGKNDLTVNVDPQGRLIATDSTGAVIQPTVQP